MQLVRLHKEIFLPTTGPLRREGHRLRRRDRPTRVERGHPRQEHHPRQQERRPQGRRHRPRRDVGARRRLLAPPHARRVRDHRLQGGLRAADQAF